MKFEHVKARLYRFCIDSCAAIRTIISRISGGRLTGIVEQEEVMEVFGCTARPLMTGNDKEQTSVVKYTEQPRLSTYHDHFRP